MVIEYIWPKMTANDMEYGLKTFRNEYEEYFEILVEHDEYTEDESEDEGDLTYGEFDKDAISDDRFRMASFLNNRELWIASDVEYLVEAVNGNDFEENSTYSDKYEKCTDANKFSLAVDLDQFMSLGLFGGKEELPPELINHSFVCLKVNVGSQSRMRLEGDILLPVASIK